MSVGTVFFGISNRFWMLVISRILQGFESSILYAVGLAVLVDTVSQDEVGQWMGIAMSCNNIGIIISPLLGGIIYDKSGKMCVFAIMVALGAMDVVLRVLVNEKTESHPQSSQTKSINMESIEAIQAEEKGL